MTFAHRDKEAVCGRPIIAGSALGQDLMWGYKFRVANNEWIYGSIVWNRKVCKTFASNWQKCMDSFSVVIL